MRHRKKINHLSRTSTHRKAMLSNMAASLIMHKRINTTVAKAKALRIYIEPLITKSKEDTTHSRRVVFSYLQNKEAVTELFREVSVKVAERHGGYTRIIKIGTRFGDNAEMCMMELVDYNENLLGGKDAKKTKTTRRRRGAKKTAGDETKAEVPKAKKETVPEDKTEEPKSEPDDKVKAETEIPAEEVKAETETPVEEVKAEAETTTKAVEEPAETKNLTDPGDSGEEKAPDEPKETKE